MPLSLDALTALDAIERRGSFAAAAAELHRVPSAITYQVQKLEQDLDVLLFDRRSHRATLTPAGRELLDSGRRLLDAAATLEQRVRRVATGWETELAVAVDAIIPWDRVWPLVGAFYAYCDSQSAAHTRLRLIREVFGGAWDALAEARADLVLGASGDPPPGGGYRIRVLAESVLQFVVAPKHPLAGAAEPLSETTIAPTTSRSAVSSRSASSRRRRRCAYTSRGARRVRATRSHGGSTPCRARIGRSAHPLLRCRARRIRDAGADARTVTRSR